MQAQHSMDWGGLRDPPPYPPDDPMTYRVSFPWTEYDIVFPLGECMGRSSIQSALRVHFVHRPVWDTQLFLEEGNHPHPRCPKCDMFVTWWELNRKHPSTAMCSRGVDRRSNQLQKKEARLSTAVDFEAYGIPLYMVMAFKYLGGILTVSDNDWPAVVANLWKAQKCWARLSHILGW